MFIRRATRRPPFSYPDGFGGTITEADPDSIVERFDEALGTDFAHAFEAAKAGTYAPGPTEAAALNLRVYEALRVAFRLRPFDERTGQGLLNAQLEDLMRALTEHLRAHPLPPRRGTWLRSLTPRSSGRRPRLGGTRRSRR